MPALTFAPSAITADPGLPFARQRIGLLYALRHHRLPNLDAPQRFTELVQWRKLCDRSALHTQLMDKVGAKRLVAASLGGDWTVPTLWEGAELPQAAPFPLPAIVKARHGCNQYAVLETDTGPARWSQVRSVATGWLSRPYGRWLDEWAYRDVPRGMLAEPLLGGALPLPVDYKIYVFGGEATHVQVHLGRGERHRWILHDRDWRQLVPAPDRPPPPPSLAAMLDAAAALGRDQDFLRIDFYDIGGRPYFGEFCLYPGSGLDPFAADWIDFELGALWHAARIERNDNLLRWPTRPMH